jgi:hypothetical protein
MSDKSKQRYALYRGDEFIDVGTADELAERHGVRAETIRWMSTPSFHKRGSGEKLMAFKIEED